MRAVNVISCLMLMIWSPLAAVAEDELPWAFKAPPAEGYSIDLVTVEPVPGTPLISGSAVEFKITVNYSMSVAKEGAIILVFQDEADRSAKPDGPQVSRRVTGRSGSVSLSERLVIPARAKELRLFVPLVPDGIRNTTGEITLRYPIQNATPGAT